MSIHRSLQLIPNFLPAPTQTLLLWHSLKLLSSPTQTTSASRKQLRTWLKQNPDFPTDPPSPTQPTPPPASHPEWPFPAPAALAWSGAHFDGVISQYREMLVRPGNWPKDSPVLTDALHKLYDLIPPATGAPAVDRTNPDPPPHVLLHLLHLSGEGEIRPHVDNLEASGGTIVSLSLGGERLLRFEKTDQHGGPGEGEPDKLEVLLEPGMVNIQV